MVEALQPIQYQILYQEIPAYASDIQRAKSTSEMQPLTRKLFDRLVKLLFPDSRIKIKQKAKDPQEKRNEESKDGLSLV